MSIDFGLGPSPSLVALAAGVFMLAGLVKGVVGMGLPTVAVGLLALWMPPAEAAVLLIVPSLLTNAWQMQPWHGVLPMLRRLWPLLAGVFLGTVAGGWWLGALAAPWARGALGLTLVVYAAWGLTGARLAVPRRAEAWLAPLVGTVTGLVTAATGVFVVPAVPYLQALQWERDELIQALGIAFTVSTLALAVILPLGGGARAGLLSLAMLVPALAGMALGQALRRRLSPTVFRRCFFAGMLLLGLHMVMATW